MQEVGEKEVYIAMATGVFPSIPAIKKTSLYKWGAWVICIVIPIFLIIEVVLQFITPPPVGRLVMVRDIPMPSAFPDSARTAQNPFAPGLTVQFDHFDFQALDPQTHLLFIAHTGPNPDREAQVNPHFHPDTDAKND